MQKADKISGSETVLLVDDKEMIIEVGQEMLKRLGYHVIVANGGRQAIDKVRAEGDQIDLVILDMIMPEINGEEVFDTIRKSRPAIPVLMSSGYTLEAQGENLLKKGLNGFIQKPFNMDKLSKTIHKILDADKCFFSA